MGRPMVVLHVIRQGDRGTVIGHGDAAAKWLAVSVERNTAFDGNCLTKMICRCYVTDFFTYIK